MEDVTIRRREHNGQTTETRESGGGVFRPLPEKHLATPVWLYGPKKARALFSCPVSAIGADVMDLHNLWTGCQLTESLPFGGGLLDQPAIVQRSFPFFADETRVMEQSTE